MLSAMEVWGVLGLGHVQGAFFGSHLDTLARCKLLFSQRIRQKGCAYRRLRKLQLAGYIKAYKLLGYPQVYGLTENGYRLLKSRGLTKLRSYCKWVSAYTLSNKLASVSVGLMLKHLKGKSLASDRITYEWQQNLKRERKWSGNLLLPDLTVYEPHIPVEIELHQKSTERYHELWDHYKECFGREIKVAYLTPTAERAEGLWITARIKDHRHIYTLDLPAFIRSIGEAAFTNCFGESLYLTREGTFG